MQPAPLLYTCHLHQAGARYVTSDIMTYSLQSEAEPRELARIKLVSIKSAILSHGGAVANLKHACDHGLGLASTARG